MNGLAELYHSLFGDADVSLAPSLGAFMDTPEARQFMRDTGVPADKLESLLRLIPTATRRDRATADAALLVQKMVALWDVYSPDEQAAIMRLVKGYTERIFLTELRGHGLTTFYSPGLLEAIEYAGALSFLLGWVTAINISKEGNDERGESEPDREGAHSGGI